MENRKKFEFEKDIIKIIEKNIKNVGIIYIFGSYAEGTERGKSDVDIAFYSLENYSEYEIFLLAQKISAEIKKEVDLVQLKKSSTVFQKEVVSKGIVIFEKDHIEREKFENIVLKKYMRLNEERKKILENYEV